MTTLKTLIPLSILCAVLVGHSYIDSAWTEPVAGPIATTNTPAPLNIGVAPQSKTGALGLESLIVFGDAEVDGTVKASTSVWSRQYCDESGGNCTSGISEDSTTTVTVAGKCFEPAWAVTCNWNWSGDGNDDSTSIIPYSMNPVTEGCSSNRTYREHWTILAECFTPIYTWVSSAWSCNAPNPSACDTTSGTNVRTVSCQNQYGGVVDDSNCTGAKPGTTGTSCTLRGSNTGCR